MTIKPTTAIVTLVVAAGCGGVRVVDDDGHVAGAPPIDGGNGGVGGAPLIGGSGGAPTTGGSGYGGACQDGFIELAGPTGERLESVCEWGAEVTDRPVGFFYTIGPEAGADFRIHGCTEPGLDGLFFRLASSPGTAVYGDVSYWKDGVEWSTVYEAFSVTTEPFGPKLGSTVVGSYAVTVTDGQDTMDLFGSFSLCRVADSGAP